MCRWLAYSGSPIRLEELLLNRDRSLIDQSLHSRLGATTTNGDGFGVGWYDDGDTPRLYRSVHPAWNDRNLRELAAGISSHLFLSHIRASTGTAIQETNTHPFRYGRWLWVHNGLIREFPRLRRELVLAIDDSLFTSIEGTTDSETMFYLALTFGLESDPVAAVERMVGFVEETGRRHGVEHPLQMTIGTTDGQQRVRVPVLERGRVAVALLQHAHGCSEGPLSGERSARRAVGRDARRRLRAARRPRGRLERGARVPRRHHPAGRRRAATVRAAAAMSEAPVDMRESLDRYRAVRRQLEEEILPLATSVDGRRFSYQASLHGLQLQPGSYVVLEQGSERRLGQVVTLGVGRHQGPELAAADAGGAAHRAQVVIRGAEGEGRVLSGDGSSFHDATVRPATPDEVRDHLEETAPRRARLEVGELLLAPGVPFSLDAGGFGRHTFLCGQSGSGKTYSLGVVLEQLLLETDLQLVVLDPNSDFVRLGELRPDADDADAARYAEATRSLAVRRAGDGLALLARGARARRCRRPRSASTRWPTVRSTPSSWRSPTAARPCPSSGSSSSSAKARPAGS